MRTNAENSTNDPTGSELTTKDPAIGEFCERMGATVGAVSVDLEQLAADLRDHLTVEQCHSLAQLLSDR